MSILLANAIGATAVAPNDGTDLPRACTALFIGGAGTLTVHTMEQQQKALQDGGYTKVTTLFTGVLAGTVLNLQCSRVLATGTTCTNIVALYV